MILHHARQGVCAEVLEPRFLFSKILPDGSEPVKDPPARFIDPAVVMDAGATFPLSALPLESSRPGAPATIYLDFTGDTTSTWGNMVPGTTPAYDTDGDPTTFSSTELANIQQIYEQIADAYSPFNVNVTTINPGNTNNPNLEVVIGGTGVWTGGAYGGIAYVASYGSSSDLYGPNKNKVFVFSDNLGAGYPKYVADDAEHEIGHAYGLSHQSTWTETSALGTPVWTLDAVYNIGDGSTGPIMGNALNDTRALFWDGTSQNASSSGAPIIQDDLSIISSSTNGFGYIPDDYGNSIASAYALSGTNAFSANGVISTNTDADFFSFTILPGSVTITATPGLPLSDPNPTLNANLQLFDASGNLLATGTQTTLAKSISTTLGAGTYYVDVSGDGTYGDLGEYGLSITTSTPSWLSNGGSLNYSLSGTGSNPMLNITSGTAILTADAGAALNNLSISVASGATLQMQTSQHLNSLALASGASAQLLAGSNSELFVNSLQLASNSTLDVANNSLQWNGAAVNAVQALLISGYNAGTWTGPGIISSTAAQQSYFALGYSSTLVPGAVVVKFARDGDANLDGTVNADDLALMAVGQQSGGNTWQQGDFNYDQKVNADDFFLAAYSAAFQG